MGAIGAILHGVGSVRVARGEDFSAGSVATRGEKEEWASLPGSKTSAESKIRPLRGGKNHRSRHCRLTGFGIEARAPFRTIMRLF